MTTEGLAPIGRPDRDYDPLLAVDDTVIHALWSAAGRIPNQPAILDGDRKLTYRQYASAVSAFAHRIRGLGAGGGRVALLMLNSMDFAVAALGTMAARAQVAPLNYDYPEAALEPLVADVEPRVLVCDATSAELARSIASRLGIEHTLELGNGGVEIDRWLDDPSPVLPAGFPDPGDPSFLIFTGGTTGVPKAADHTHANDVAYARCTATMWNLTPDSERILNVAPNFHVWGFCKMVVTPPFNGACVDILPRYKPADVLERLESQRATVFAGGPAAMYVGLRANERFATTALSELKYCLAGGSPCSEDLLRGWEADTGVPILEGWGMTEGAPCNVNPAVGVRKIGSTGITVPRTEMDVVDLDTGTRVLPPGERGEIRVRGPQFVSGYFHRPEETAIAFRDGWLYTGDIGYFDEDGYMFLVDRKKEMIIVGGYNVYPREIDEVLNSHPAILEAAAIGVPHDFRGETVKACVALHPGAELVADELLAYLGERLVRYKLPGEIEFYDALPKTGPGKIDKLELKDQR